MSDTFGGAGYGAADPSAAGSTGNSGGDSSFVPPPLNTTGPLTSAWGRDFTSRSQIRANKYVTDQGYEPLRKRLFEWRTQYVQAGDADLERVLDFYLRWDDPSPRSGGIAGHAKRHMEDWQDQAGRKKTVATWLEEFRTADQAKMTSYQDALFAAGYYDPKVYKNPALLRSGRYDDYTQDAVNRLLKDAVMSTGPGEEPMSLSELLRIRKGEVDERGGTAALAAAGGEQPAFTATTTNSADIAAAEQDAAYNLIGRRNVDVTGSAAEYQGLQVGAQRSEYDQTYGGGGVTEQEPSLGTFAEQQVREEAPAEVDAYATLGAFNELLRMIGAAG